MVVAWRKEADQLKKKAEQLERRATQREKEIKDEMVCELEVEHGPFEPYVETFDIEFLDDALRQKVTRLGRAGYCQFKLHLADWAA